MKKIVVYYSLSGNTKTISEAIANEINADILELIPKKKIKSKSTFMRILRGVFQILRRKTPKLLPFQYNPENYDLIILGTPVWANTYTPAIKSFFKDVKLKNKKIILFSCQSDRKRKLAIEAMTEELQKNNEIIADNVFHDKEKSTNKEKAISWIKEVLS